MLRFRGFGVSSLFSLLRCAAYTLSEASARTSCWDCRIVVEVVVMMVVGLGSWRRRRILVSEGAPPLFEWPQGHCLRQYNGRVLMMHSRVWTVGETEVACVRCEGAVAQIVTSTARVFGGATTQRKHAMQQCRCCEIETGRKLCALEALVDGPGPGPGKKCDERRWPCTSMRARGSGFR
jgi:hypothetical protein